jgi:hypothetical protein
MNSQTRRQTAEFLGITDCNGYSGSTPVSRFEIPLPGVRHELAAAAPLNRKPRQAAVAVWVILIVVIAATGAFWATNQLCALLAQRIQQVQRQSYSQRTPYSDLWKPGRHR